jgi:hypothetical protein
MVLMDVEVITMSTRSLFLSDLMSYEILYYYLYFILLLDMFNWDVTT